MHACMFITKSCSNQKNKYGTLFNATIKGKQTTKDTERTLMRTADQKQI